MFNKEVSENGVRVHFYYRLAWVIRTQFVFSGYETTCELVCHTLRLLSWFSLFGQVRRFQDMWLRYAPFSIHIFCVWGPAPIQDHRSGCYLARETTCSLVTSLGRNTSSSSSRNQQLCFGCSWVIVVDWFFPLVLVVDCSDLEVGHLEWSVGPPRYGRNRGTAVVRWPCRWFLQNCSPLFLGVGLVLASGVKCLSDWLN